MPLKSHLDLLVAFLNEFLLIINIIFVFTLSIQDYIGKYDNVSGREKFGLICLICYSSIL